MDDEKIKRLNAFLATHKTSCEIISSSQVNYLSRIDDAIQARLCEIKSAEATLKARRITIQSIAEETQISRKTVYNNKLLKQYIESYMSVPLDVLTENKEQIKSLQNEVSQLQEEKKKFVLRDCEIEMIRKALETTQQLLEKKQQEYNDLEAKYRNLLHERDLVAERPQGKILTPKKGNIGAYFRPQVFD